MFLGRLLEAERSDDEDEAPKALARSLNRGNEPGRRTPDFCSNFASF